MTRIAVLDVSFDPVTSDELVDRMAEAVARRERLKIAHHNLHSAYLLQRGGDMRGWYKLADVVYADGMSLVALAWLARRGARRRHRTTPLDLIDPLFGRAAQEGWRVFLLGGRPGVPERFALAVRERFPGAQLGIAHGYFNADTDSAENESVVAEINRFRADLLLVGMGMPRQEVWLAQNHRALQATVLMPVGGLFDYLAGETRVPPRWLGRFGLEWLYRLVSEPRRLAFRYLAEPAILAVMVVRKRLR
jgi:N-acetylglucosaminyldiphosphoundecaprenol N-acetyl-beta-D-mannosaminyltransferase